MSLPFKENHELQEKYLDELARTGQPAKAARKIGFSSTYIAHYSQPSHDKFWPEWAERVHEARLAYRDFVEDEVRRRAIEGVDEPVFNRGVQVRDADGEPAVVKRYSDRLLELHAKKTDPSYRDHTVVEQTNLNVDAAFEDLEKLSPEKRALVRRLLEDEEDDGPPSDVS